MRLAFVVWSGSIGGAETLSASLAREMRRQGVPAGLVFVTDDQPLAGVLRDWGVPYRSLGLERGSHVLLHPRDFASAVSEIGPDGAILDAVGYQGLALRLGGYAGPIVCVEHGGLLEVPGLSPARRLIRRLDRLSGIWANDVVVAVSDFIYSEILRHLHPRRVARIYNGVDLDRYAPKNQSAGRESCVVGWAGRLIRGKGVNHLIHAQQLLTPEIRIELRIAGNGPERGSLEALADSLGMRERVVFQDWVLDMPSFWRDCDLAAFPSDTVVESFGLAAVEAMACGKPVVFSRLGGLAEVAADGETGIAVSPGSVRGLADALRRYALDRDLLNDHGRQGRARCEELFDLRLTAERYLALIRGEGAR